MLESVRHRSHLTLVSSLSVWCRRMQATIGQGALNSPIEELHVKELQEILERISQDDADDVQLIDVREDFEHQTASLPGFKLMPMSRYGPVLLSCVSASTTGLSQRCLRSVPCCSLLYLGQAICPHSVGHKGLADEVI